MATTTMGNSTGRSDTKKGIYWAIAAGIVVVLAFAYMVMSNRNNATGSLNEGNNMSNTNSPSADSNTPSTPTNSTDPNRPSSGNRQ